MVGSRDGDVQRLSDRHERRLGECGPAPNDDGLWSQSGSSAVDYHSLYDCWCRAHPHRRLAGELAREPQPVSAQSPGLCWWLSPVWCGLEWYITDPLPRRARHRQWPHYAHGDGAAEHRLSPTAARSGHGVIRFGSGLRPGHWPGARWVCDGAPQLAYGVLFERARGSAQHDPGGAGHSQHARRGAALSGRRRSGDDDCLPR